MSDYQTVHKYLPTNTIPNFCLYFNKACQIRAIIRSKYHELDNWYLNTNIFGNKQCYLPLLQSINSDSEKLIIVLIQTNKFSKSSHLNSLHLSQCYPCEHFVRYISLYFLRFSNHAGNTHYSFSQVWKLDIVSRISIFVILCKFN